MSTRARSGRAAPLPPDERRRAILDAVQPVILERGLDVTTRQLADAAGVAEGTLFRVFADKESLVREAAFAAADPAHAAAAIAAIDTALPLEERLVQLVDVMGERIGRVRVWMTLLHRLGRGDDTARRGGPPTWAERQRLGAAAVHAQVARLLAPDAGRLRCRVDEAVPVVDALVLGTLFRAGRVVPLGEESTVQPVDARGIVDLLLHGLLAHAAPPPAAPGAPPSDPLAGEPPATTEGH